MTRIELKHDWCTLQAAKYACRHWHYSRVMPAGKLVKIGVWENAQYIGCVLFGRGAGPQIGSPYGLKQTELCELTRIALNKHVTPVGRIVKIAFKLLRRQSPGLRLVISFADCEQGHHGGIYAAGGWLYLGTTKTHRYVMHGKRTHPRTVASRYGRQDMAWLRSHVDANTHRIDMLLKHKYVFPLDDELRNDLLPQTKPYPKRAGSVGGGTTDVQSVGGGSIPTPALPLK